jgi:DNA invertase Pin-like site-specific DNA recombinase
MNLKRPTIAIIYTRVSSTDQLEGYSLESQEKICREYV